MVRSLVLAFLLGTTAALAQGTEIGFGGLKQDTTLPVEISAETMTVDQADGSVEFVGNVIIGQGEMRLSAQKVEVRYDEAGQRVSSLAATGGVTLVSGADAAEAQTADYDVDKGVVVMRGDVLLTRGGNALSAQEMTVELDSGTARMAGRVRTVLQGADSQ